MATKDFLATKKAEIADRLNELKPLVDEYAMLEQAYAALNSVSSTPTKAAGRATATGSPAARPAASASAGKKRGPGRPRGRSSGNTRANQAIELIRANPGITVGEVAKQLKVRNNYIYRVMSGLQREGLVKRKGGGLHATG